MKTKLTLTVEESIIAEAKRYSKRRVNHYPVCLKNCFCMQKKFNQSQKGLCCCQAIENSRGAKTVRHWMIKS